MSRNRPLPPDASTLRRITAVPGEIRRRGFGWLIRRLTKEVRSPLRIPGKIWRVAQVTVYSGGLKAVSLLLRPFTNRSTIYVFYDLQVSPVTYDISWSMVAAEQRRRARGLRDIHFIFVPGPDEGLRTEDPDYEEAVDKSARRWRFAQILIPMLQQLPTITGHTICTSRAHATCLRVLHGRHIYPELYWPRLPVAHKPHHILEPARDGTRISLPLRATPQALRHIEQWCTSNVGSKKLIVITLRDYGYMPQRNSNIDAWTAFAAELDKQEYQIVFVPDTETAFAPRTEMLHEFPVMAEAAWNLSLRMALYETAYLNLMVNNGPHGLCMFNEKCRYVMFKILTESARQTTREYMEFLGFEIGQSPPFSTPYQKWVWEDDELAVITREFGNMCDKIEKRA